MTAEPTPDPRYQPPADPNAVAPVEYYYPPQPYYPAPAAPPPQDQRAWQRTVLWGVSIWVLGPFVLLLLTIAVCMGGCGLLAAMGRSSTPPPATFQNSSP